MTENGTIRLFPRGPYFVEIPQIPSPSPRTRFVSLRITPGRLDLPSKGFKIEAEMDRKRGDEFVSIVSNPAWLFVISSAIAVVGIVLSFKLSVSNLLSAENSGEETLRAGFQKEFIRFITRLLFIEALPLILTVWGIIQIFDSVEVEVEIPLILVFLILVFGWIQIFLTRSQVMRDPHSSASLNRHVSNFSMITIALASALPLISLMMLIMKLADLV